MKLPVRIYFLLMTTVLITAGCGAGNNSRPEPEVMQALDLSAHGIPLTIKAPAGATVIKDSLTGGLIVAKGRFNILIDENKFGDDLQPAEQLKEEQLKTDTRTYKRPDIGFNLEVLRNEPNGYVYVTTNKTGNKVVRFKFIAEKNRKKYIIQENFTALLDIKKAMETDYAINQAEAETMYKAVKQ